MINTLCAILLGCTSALSTDTLTDVTHEIEEVVVSAGTGGVRRLGGAVNGVNIGQKEMFRAACCNLGESFSTNPSVDVSYNDAATGAKQIKLLGLSGAYVQMLTENMPNFTGAALPYALDYIPGTWMKSIQVSKGASSVKNGVSAMTGQINVQYLQPEDEEHVHLNFFGDSKTRFEANADANYHLNDRLSTVLMLHGDKSFDKHDSNGDGFYDTPKTWQMNIGNRWTYLGNRYIFHGGASVLKENRVSGQIPSCLPSAERIYKIGVNTDRYEAYMKHAFILNKEKGMNIALMSSLASHNADAAYGDRFYNVKQRTLFAQLLFERNYGEHHNLAVGADARVQWYDTAWNLTGQVADTERTSGYECLWDEGGGYVQYTYNLHDWLIVMGGIHSTTCLLGESLTDLFMPRMHVKVAPWKWGELRLSAGKGQRVSHYLQENHYLLASGRELILNQWTERKDYDTEQTWNYGGSLAFTIPLFGRDLKLNADYYYTRFIRQVVADYDCNPHYIVVRTLDTDSHDESYSHCIQVDATYTPFHGFDVTAAFRRNISRASAGGHLHRFGNNGPHVQDRLFTPKYKGLLSLAYKPGLGLWHFDATLQMNGPAALPSELQFMGYWSEYAKPCTANEVYCVTRQRYSPAFFQLSAQVTREFRYFDLYVGGENLTGYKQQNAIINAADPWSADFDATQVWGPTHGQMVYAGVRVKL